MGCYIVCYIWLFVIARHAELVYKGMIIKNMMKTSDNSFAAMYKRKEFILSNLISTETAALCNLLIVLIFGLLLLTLVSYRFKISLHASGAGFLLAVSLIVCTVLWTMDIDYGIVSTFVLFLLSALAYLLLLQRIESGAHSKRQVRIGFFGGFLHTFIICGLLYLNRHL